MVAEGATDDNSGRSITHGDAFSDRTYRKLFERSPGLYLVLTPHLQIVAVTDAYLQATMTKRDAIVGLGLFDVFPDNPNDPQATGVGNLRRSLETVLNTKKAHTMALQRYDIRSPDHHGQFEVRFWSPINTPIIDDRGEVEFIVHRVEDVTDYVATKQAEGEREAFMRDLQDRSNHMELELVKRAEEIVAANREIEEQQKASRRLEALVEAMPDGVFVAIESGTVALANRQAESLFGYSCAELIGMAISELIPGPDLTVDRLLGQPPDPRASRRDRITGRWPLARHKDGSQFPVHVAISALDTERGRVEIYSARDMTVVQHAEEAMHATQARYHELLDNMLESAQILSFEWRYLYLNDAAARNGKQVKEEMLGKTVMERFPGIERSEMFRSLAECMSERKSVIRDFEFIYPEGETAWFTFSIQPVPEGLFILALDITDRKHGEQAMQLLNESLDLKVQMRTAQLEAANKELESFSYSVSHDLRAPLRHIHGYVEMLGRATKGQLSDKALRYLSIISAASLEMSQLIDDLLAFSRMGRLEFANATVSLSDLVGQAVRAIDSGGAGRHIDWHIGELPFVIGDPAMLKLVFGNLIGNAVKYSRNRDIPRIEIKSEGVDLQRRVVITVNDNGAGFDMQYVHKLFGVFQRLHRADEFEGTGIGLALVKRIVDRHGGSVWAEGEIDHGATFFVALNPAN
ncbi:MAG: PAS domain S-box protein [Fimbriimonas sp.]|nr:PAS domain S-box protein [Fimbriimonas sp.]